jgi:hypothetical protein
MAARFMIAKPFDCYISVDGALGAMEAKYLDTNVTKTKAGKPRPGAKWVCYKDLRDNQHEGLLEVMKYGGQAWVFYEIKVGKEHRLYTWDYSTFRRLCMQHDGAHLRIPMDIVLKLPHVKRGHTKFYSSTYDLTYFISEWKRHAEELKDL